MAPAKKDKKPVKTPTAEKRMRQNLKRRTRNRAFTSSVRTAIRHFEDSLKDGSPEDVRLQISLVYSKLDKGVKRGIFTLNKASRTKARLTSRAQGKLASA